MRADLSELARSLVTTGGGPFAFCGIGLGDTCYTACADGITADEHSYWRAASISKLVTGRAAYGALARASALDATVEDILNISFRAPNGTPPKVAHLASHQSGITDAGGYLVPPRVALSDWIAQQGEAIWSGSAPAAQFEYSNLGFVILAACAEVVSGARFSDLTQSSVGAFNWNGLKTSRLSILPTFRRSEDGTFTAQIDGDGPTRPTVPTPYVLGDYVAAVSPQGGLRTSLRNLLSLGATLRDHPTDQGWHADPAHTIGPVDLFQSYAWGAQIFDAPAFYPRPLIGHFANAYGFCGGVWLDCEKDRVFAYALNGLAQGDEDDGLRAEERAIFDAVAQLA